MKKKRKVPVFRPRKIYEKRDWWTLEPGGGPFETDYAGAKSALAWARAKGTMVHTQRDEIDPTVYWVWRLL